MVFDCRLREKHGGTIVRSMNKGRLTAMILWRFHSRRRHVSCLQATDESTSE